MVVKEEEPITVMAAAAEDLAVVVVVVEVMIVAERADVKSHVQLSYLINGTSSSRVRARGSPWNTTLTPPNVSFIYVDYNYLPLLPYELIHTRLTGTSTVPPGTSEDSYGQAKPSYQKTPITRPGRIITNYKVLNLRNPSVVRGHVQNLYQLRPLLQRPALWVRKTVKRPLYLAVRRALLRLQGPKLLRGPNLHLDLLSKH
ncbi:hypothetical protein BO94DRAFT_581161 [Aspergillus sclerotioniger CBS 115572]|uniref:Uncharacterized protein n=1 Tax=Aspergillus sclerotioniger CBS 115572 TaxID=1450535 RepID=A0A317XBR1_9EURO|nr:hypothetical protein BO94DRAFT_581161 [Aspergillus sclerotioniger CBS 115572]PWY96016.1 hypothetical protein BO94DRAFT_581161 [Aspergillus sclerotioniger CBS 115572]